MCDKTFPVFRSGSILKADHPFNADQAVQAGRQLRDARRILSDRLVATLSAHVDVTNVVPEDPDAVRVRLLPAVTIDFMPLAFDWRNHRMNFRACFTVCPGSRKAKIWTRFNFKDAQDNKEVVADFYRWVPDMSVRVHEASLSFYNDQLGALELGSRLSRTYAITIRLVSTATAEVREQLEKEFTRAIETERSKDHAYQLLLKELGGDCGLDVPRKTLGERTQLVGFRYTRKRHESLDLQTEPRDAVEHLTMIPSPPLGDNFEALCIVDYNQDGMDITGVAHEPIPPKDFRRSAPHVVSGEISFEVGNAY